jgi:hypothetical protein
MGRAAGEHEATPQTRAEICCKRVLRCNRRSPYRHGDMTKAARRVQEHPRARHRSGNSHAPAAYPARAETGSAENPRQSRPLNSRPLRPLPRRPRLPHRPAPQLRRRPGARRDQPDLLDTAQARTRHRHQPLRADHALRAATLRHETRNARRHSASGSAPVASAHARADLRRWASKEAEPVTGPHALMGTAASPTPTGSNASCCGCHAAGSTIRRN